MPEETNPERPTTGWLEAVPPMAPATRTFYESYTGLQGTELETHILDVRLRAIKVARYPCIAVFHFLNYPLGTQPLYPTLKTRAREGANVLDLGCGLGQDLRRFAWECGISAADARRRFVGVDVSRELWGVGYDLFRDDEGSSCVTFVQSDLLKGDAEIYTPGFKDRFDVIHANSLLHLFSYDDQLAIVKKLVGTARVGCVMVGSQMGSTEPKHIPHEKFTMFLHDEDSFVRLWKQAGDATGQEWSVEVELLTLVDAGMSEAVRKRANPDTRRLRFAVTRTK